MIGTALKKLFEERNVSVNEMARRAEVSPQTLYSIIRRDSMKIDFDLLLRLCTELDVPVDYFYNRNGPEMPSVAEMELIGRYRRLDVHGKNLIDLVMDAEALRINSSEASSSSPDELEDTQKVIPLYSTPAAAGYASPVIGEDYEEHKVERHVPADFAVRISGDSMEPFIKDGSIALVKRGETIHDGDIGLFYAAGGMVCKQYCQDYAGNVYLFSLNRARSDADLHISSGSTEALLCFGKVLMPKAPPLP